MLVFGAVCARRSSSIFTFRLIRGVAVVLWYSTCSYCSVIRHAFCRSWLREVSEDLYQFFCDTEGSLWQLLLFIRLAPVGRCGALAVAQPSLDIRRLDTHRSGGLVAWCRGWHWITANIVFGVIP